MADFSLYRGEYKVIRGTATRDGAALDLTGATLRLAARKELPVGASTSDSGALFTKATGSGITLSDPANGIFDIELLKADTNSLEIPSGRALEIVFGVEVQLPGDPGARVLAQGTIEVLADVVRSL